MLAADHYQPNEKVFSRSSPPSQLSLNMNRHLNSLHKTPALLYVMLYLVNAGPSKDSIDGVKDIPTVTVRGLPTTVSTAMPTKDVDHACRHRHQICYREASLHLRRTTLYAYGTCTAKKMDTFGSDARYPPDITSHVDQRARGYILRRVCTSV